MQADRTKPHELSSHPIPPPAPQSVAAASALRGPVRSGNRIYIRRPLNTSRSTPTPTRVTAPPAKTSATKHRPVTKAVPASSQRNAHHASSRAKSSPKLEPMAVAAPTPAPAPTRAPAAGKAEHQRKQKPPSEVAKPTAERVTAGARRAALAAETSDRTHVCTSAVTAAADGAVREGGRCRCSCNSSDAPVQSDSPVVTAPPPTTAAVAPASASTLPLPRSTSETFRGVLWVDLFPTCIAPYLTVGDVSAVACVCRAAYRAVRLPCVWRTLAAVHLGVVQPNAVEALATMRGCGSRTVQAAVPTGFFSRMDGLQPLPAVLATPDDVGTREPLSAHETHVIPEETEGASAEVGAEDEGHQHLSTMLRGLESQMPTPCERGGSNSTTSASTPPPPATSACCANSTSSCHTGGGTASLSAPPTAWCGAQDADETATCSLDTAPACSTPAPAPVPAVAASPPFPWEGYVRVLHKGRVAEFLQYLRRQERIRVSDLEVEGFEDTATDENEDEEGDEEDGTASSNMEPSNDSSSVIAVASKRRLVHRLTYSINVLCQRSTSGAMSAEHMAYLANSLTSRGRLLLDLAPSEDSDPLPRQDSSDDDGSRATAVSPQAAALALALEDLAVAELLTPHDGSLSALVDEVVVRLEATLVGGDGDARMSHRCLADWLAECDLAARQPRPFAVLAVGRRMRFHLRQNTAATGPAVDPVQQQQQQLIVLVSTYLHVLETLGLSLTHLLVEAAAVAASPQERLTVAALRHLAAAFASAGTTTTPLPEAAVGAAVDCVDMAVNVLSCPERAAVAAAATAWQTDWLLNPHITLEEMVGKGLTRYRSHIAVSNGTSRVMMSLERVTLLSLTYYILSMAYGIQTGCDPLLHPNIAESAKGLLAGSSASLAAQSGSSSGGGRASRAGAGAADEASVPAPPLPVTSYYDALIHYLALSQCHHRQAAALTRLASLYTYRDEHGALPTGGDGGGAATDMDGAEDDEGDRLPMPDPTLPAATSPMNAATGAPAVSPIATVGAAVALRLLHTAVHLNPVCVPAHVLLSRIYARRERGELAAQPLPPLAMSAYELLSRCVHGYAVPFLPEDRRNGLSTLSGEAAEDSGVPYLRRKERHPSRCFIPAELLAERSRVPKTHGNGSLLFFTTTARSLAAAPQPEPLSQAQAPVSYVGHAPISHRSLADIYEAALHNPRASYPRQVKAAVALDAATHVRLASPPRPGEDDGEPWGAESGDVDDSAFRSLFASADKELAEITSLYLQPHDVALRLRFLSDYLQRRIRPPSPGRQGEPVPPQGGAEVPNEGAYQQPGSPRQSVRERRLQTQVLHQLGLLTVLMAGQAQAAEVGCLGTSSAFFPTELRARVPEGVNVFLDHVERLSLRM